MNQHAILMSFNLQSEVKWLNLQQFKSITQLRDLDIHLFWETQEERDELIL